MRYEIEVKVRCDDVIELKKKITLLNGRFLGSEKQVDTYFNHPSRDFMLTDEALRIRMVNNKNIITYKGPKLMGEAKTRIENEVEISDIEPMKIILENLGFTIAGDVKKNREIYGFNDITLCVDDVFGLGTYLEIEKISDDRVKSEKELLDFAESLGYNKFEKKSYIELLIDKDIETKKMRLLICF